MNADQYNEWKHTSTMSSSQEPISSRLDLSMSNSISSRTLSPALMNGVEGGLNSAPTHERYSLLCCFTVNGGVHVHQYIMVGPDKLVKALDLLDLSARNVHNFIGASVDFRTTLSLYACM